MIHPPHSPRRRRSALYVPAINARAIEKVATLSCDAIILDLEDSVAPEAKAEARLRARAALESGLLAGKEVIVRINALSGDAGDEWMAEDLAALVPGTPDAILVPKIRSAEDVLRAHSALDHHFAPDSIALWLMMETPEAVLHAGAITALAGQDAPRLDCLIMGTNDLAKEMRLPYAASRLALLHVLSASVLAARAHGLDILDGVFGDIRDPAGFEAECFQGRGLGFDGKTLIHPSQIEIAARVFSPSPGEIEEARAIVAAFEAPENAGRGVLVVGGRMVERLHCETARRILVLAGEM